MFIANGCAGKNLFVLEPESSGTGVPPVRSPDPNKTHGQDARATKPGKRPKLD
jgi:hypothetical protein